MKMEMVWVQNLKGFINGTFPADEKWKTIFIEQLDALAAPASAEPVAWQPIETAPKNGEFIVYGSYLYPDDTSVTEYMAVGRSTGKPEYPIETQDGEALLGVFTHWRHLPSPPITINP